MGRRSTGSGCCWRRDRHGGEPTFKGEREGAAKAAPGAVPTQERVAVAVAVTLLLCAATCRAETTVLDWFYGTPYQYLEVVIGDTVQWRWGDTRPHSVLGIGSAANEFTGLGGGNNLVTGFGFIYNHTFRKVGSYQFICGSDSFVMTGMVIVKPLEYEGNVTIMWYLGQTVNGASAIIKEGATVTWVWDDALPHGLASDSGDKSVFPGLGGGTDLAVEPFQYKKTFTRAGYYLYHCSNHGTQMRGNITVRPKNGGPIPNAPPSVPLPPMPPSPHPPGFVQPPVIPPPPGRPFSPPPRRTPPPTLKKLPPAGSSPPPPSTKRPPTVLSKSPPPAKTPPPKQQGKKPPPSLARKNPPPGWRPAPRAPSSKSPSMEKPPPALRRPPPTLRRSPPPSVLRKLPPPKAISGSGKQPLLPKK